MLRAEWRSQVICPSGGLLKGVSIPLCKNISLHPSGKSSLQARAIPSHQRGVSRSSRTRGGMRWTRQRLARKGIAGQVERFVSDQQHADERRLQRTAKSCGPDAPTLASSLRMLCRPYRASDTTSVRKRRWQKSPVTEESTKETVKTIACGNAGQFRCTRCYSCAFYHYKCTRGRGCSGHPAFPTPSWGRKIIATPRVPRAARSKACAKLHQRHCEEQSDEAIHSFFTPLDGLLRFARNDGLKTVVTH